MKPHKVLFEDFLQGRLTEEEVARLNGQLIDTYFKPDHDLDPDEFTYTEDLIFEANRQKNLAESYHHLFQDKLKTDPALNRRYLLAARLEEESASYQELMSTAPEETESAGEEELRVMLEEVLEKVHAEEEKQSLKAWINVKWEALGDYLSDLIDSLNMNQTRYRLVYSVITVFVITLIVFLAVDPFGKRDGGEQRMAGNMKQQQDKENVKNNTQKPIKPEDRQTNQVSTSNPVEQAESKVRDILNPDNTKLVFTERMKKAAIDRLVKGAFRIFGSFEISQTRGETTDLMDSLIMASEKYTSADYNACRTILENLKQSHPDMQEDTSSQISFFLGNCLLNTGLAQKNDSLILLSLQSFASVSAESSYHLPSLWYSAIGQAKTGKPKESIVLLDSLINMKTYKPLQAKRLKHSLLELEKR